MFPCRDDPHWIKTQNMEKKRKENYTKSQKNEVIQFSQLNFFFFFLIFFLFSFITETKTLLFRVWQGIQLLEVTEAK